MCESRGKLGVPGFEIGVLVSCYGCGFRFGYILEMVDVEGGCCWGWNDLFVICHLLIIYLIVIYYKQQLIISSFSHWRVSFSLLIWLWLSFISVSWPILYSFSQGHRYIHWVFLLWLSSSAIPNYRLRQHSNFRGYSEIFGRTRNFMWGNLPNSNPSSQYFIV